MSRKKYNTSANQVARLHLPATACQFIARSAEQASGDVFTKVSTLLDPGGSCSAAWKLLDKTVPSL